MILHNVTGTNRWCGPAAISALTGAATQDAATVIRSISGQRACTGVTTTHLLRSLNAFGVRAKQEGTFSHHPVNKRPTLAQLMRTLDWSKTYLVVAGNHFQVVAGGCFVDSITREVVGTSHAKVGQRRRVFDFYEITAEEITTPAAIGAARDEKNAKARERRAINKAKARAKAHGISVEPDWDNHFWVYPGKEVAEHEHYLWEGHHLLYRDEVVERIDDLIKFIQRNF